MLAKFMSPLLVLMIISIGCTEKETIEPTEPILVKIDTLSQFMDFDSHGISRPGALALMSNGNLAVADGQLRKITIVTPKGDSISQFGKEGRGPAEFLSPGQIKATSNLIHVVDISQFKVLEFDHSGNFIEGYPYETKAFDRNIAIDEDRTFYSGAAGEDNKLIKWSDTKTDSSFLFGEAKISEVEDMDMEASRNDIINGRIPDYLKNNVNVILGDEHIYAFLDSYSELRKYDKTGNLIWEKKLTLPDNEQLENNIIEAAKNSNHLPFLRYTVDVKAVGSDIYLLGGKPRENPQHLTKVNEDGSITAFYQIPDPEMYFINFTINPDNKTIYLSDIMNGMVYKGSLTN
ncbi:MAG: 6-bladed beta-propeller [Gracilimonas sp.]